MIIIPLMALISRAAGGGVLPLPKWASGFPEILFGLLFGLCALQITGSPVIAVLGWLLSYLAMETGHGNAYHMGFAKDKYPDRVQTLDAFVRPITNAFGFLPRSTGYCWVFMATKGFLIGLAAFPFGLLLSALWPASYWLSFRVTKDSVLAEYLSGACAGLVIFLSW